MRRRRSVRDPELRRRLWHTHGAWTSGVNQVVYSALALATKAMISGSRVKSQAHHCCA